MRKTTVLRGAWIESLFEPGNAGGIDNAEYEWPLPELFIPRRAMRSYRQDEFPRGATMWKKGEEFREYGTWRVTVEFIPHRRSRKRR